MKYADRRASPAAVMVGEDELRDGTVTVKDLALGRKLAEGLTDNQAWRGERPGQVTVPRSELISAVKATLA
jgi:histidyl-tRNA synthetase